MAFNPWGQFNNALDRFTQVSQFNRAQKEREKRTSLAEKELEFNQKRSENYMSLAQDQNERAQERHKNFMQNEDERRQKEARELKNLQLAHFSTMIGGIKDQKTLDAAMDNLEFLGESLGWDKETTSAWRQEFGVYNPETKARLDQFSNSLKAEADINKDLHYVVGTDGVTAIMTVDEVRKAWPDGLPKGFQIYSDSADMYKNIKGGDSESKMRFKAQLDVHKHNAKNLQEALIRGTYQDPITGMERPFSDEERNRLEKKLSRTMNMISGYKDIVLEASEVDDIIDKYRGGEPKLGTSKEKKTTPKQRTLEQIKEAHPRYKTPTHEYWQKKRIKKYLPKKEHNLMDIMM